ncbi:MAG: hypothetical protein JNL67_08110 [Planctomycetaceae bacterium]|nr:hypothetical protein [Planctomycetaceae bacterium]
MKTTQITLALIALTFIGVGVWGRGLFNRQTVDGAKSMRVDRQNQTTPNVEEPMDRSVRGQERSDSEPSREQHMSIAEQAHQETDQKFLRELRRVLQSGQQIPRTGSALEAAYRVSSFPQQYFGFVLKVYQPGHSSFKAVSTRDDGWGDIHNVVTRSAKHPRLAKFTLADPAKARLQLDFISHEPLPVKVRQLSQTSTDETRFEMGVDGIMASDGKKTVYFLPGDAYIESLLTIDQLLAVVERSFPSPRQSVIHLSRFRSQSYISYEDRWLRLFRGHPIQPPFRSDQLRSTALAGSDFLVRTQLPDGRFRYYYDAASDSYKDHQHPDRDVVNNPYYNDLRHSGGALLLLLDFMETGDRSRLTAVKKAHEYLSQHLVRYETNAGNPAAYVYYNRKGKLGGSGIYLYVLSEYRRLSGDNSFAEIERLLVTHLLSEIQDDGEFIYYHVYLDKRVDRERNRELFSFFYPGEALCGLVAYYKNSASPAEKVVMQTKIKSALRFLIEERPQLYPDQFAELPSDSWLMMAINDLWDVPELRWDGARDFVFEDAEQMVSHMYHETDALYFDYCGSFYYEYGDFPFADGARAEGLLAGYQLAVKVGDSARSERFLSALKKLAWATLHLANTPESVYAVPNPEMSLGGIRFKHTRQWFRVDTIQHVAGFYLKFLPDLRRLERESRPIAADSDTADE